MAEALAIARMPRARNRRRDSAVRRRRLVANANERPRAVALDEIGAADAEGLDRVRVYEELLHLALGVDASRRGPECEAVIDDLGGALDGVLGAANLGAELGALRVTLAEDELGGGVLDDRECDGLIVAVEVERTLRGENEADACRAALTDEADEAVIDGVAGLVDVEGERLAQISRSRGERAGEVLQIFEDQPGERGGDLAAHLGIELEGDDAIALVDLAEVGICVRGAEEGAERR